MTNKKTITIYLLVSLFIALLIVLHSAIYVTFLLEKGLDSFQVSMINLFYMVAVFIMEVPTGAIADIWGRKFSFILSVILNSIGFLIYNLANGFFGFVSAEVIIALGTTLISGVLKSWLVDSLNFYNRNGGLRKVFCLEGRMINMARMLGGLVGAFLGVKDLSVPFAVIGIGYWFSAFLSYVATKEEYFQRKNNKIKPLCGFKEVIKSGMIYGFQNDIIFLIIAIVAIFSLSFQLLNIYWQPQFKSFLLGNQYFNFIWIIIIIFAMLSNKLIKSLSVFTKNIRLTYLFLNTDFCLAGFVSVFPQPLIKTA